MKPEQKRAAITLPLLLLCCGWLQSTQAAPEDTDAGKSRELEVEETFAFETHKTVILDISATDTLGAPLGGSLVRVYAVKGSATESVSSPPAKADLSLLTMGKTNAAGWLERRFEVPQHYKVLWITLDAIGDDNQRLVTLEDNTAVSLQF